MSFSNTAVDNVPLITAFSNSALPSALICHPVAFAVNPDINGSVSIVPSDLITIPGLVGELTPILDIILVLSKDQLAIWFLFPNWKIS